MTTFGLSDGIFAPHDLLIVQSVYEHIVAQPWFSKGAAYRSKFATVVLETYRRGLVMPDELYDVCYAAAMERFKSGKSDIEGYRFLVVEDDYMIAMDACDRLSELGVETLGPAATVGDALELIEHGPEIDGAILDINLNGEMSYPVAGFLKMKSIPFIFLSGYDERILPAFFRDAAACSKPADWAAVAIALAHARTRPNVSTELPDPLHLAS